MSFKDIFEKVMDYATENLPTICAAFAATTSVGALALGITSQKKVDEKITDDMTKAEKAGVYLEEQAGTVIVEVLAVGAIGLARHASQARIDELESKVAAAVNLACVAWERARLTEEKTKELVGEEKTEEIKNAVAKEVSVRNYAKTPIADRDPDIYRFEDPWFNCYFYMTYRDFTTGIYAAEAHFHRESYITPAEIYYYLGKKAPEGSENVAIDICTVSDENHGDCKLPIVVNKRETDEGIPFFEIDYDTMFTQLNKVMNKEPRILTQIMLDDR